MSAHATLEVRDLVVEFPKNGRRLTAVNKLSFSVAPGEGLAIVGESGSGKSVTSLAALNLIPSPGRIASGSVHFDGRDVLALGDAELRRLRGGDIGMVFQDPSSALNPLFRVRRQLTDVIRTHRDVSRAEARARAEEVLTAVGFPDARHRMEAYPAELSGGLRQRVAIALALACEPGLVIADEPTTNLDVSIQAQIVELLQSLRQRLGFSVVFITHDIGLTPHVADRVMVMYAGEAVEVGPVRSVMSNPAHPYTVGLLRSAPSLRSRREQRLQAIPGAVRDLSVPWPGAPFAGRCPVAVDGVCEARKPAWQACGEDHWVACHRFARDGREGTAWAS